MVIWILFRIFYNNKIHVPWDKKHPHIKNIWKLNWKVVSISRKKLMCPFQATMTWFGKLIEFGKWNNSSVVRSNVRDDQIQVHLCMVEFNNYVTPKFMFLTPNPPASRSITFISINLERDVTISELPPSFTIEKWPNQSCFYTKIFTFW